MSHALIIGTGGIGAALKAHWQQQPALDQVWSLGSRAGDATHLQCEHTEAGVQWAQRQLTTKGMQFTRIAICTGLLHERGLQPEKRLEDVSAANLQRSLFANAIYPALWLSALLPLMHPDQCVVAACSARVGSIEDNRLGGWYSYRAAKAALNMLLKTASVEYGRRAKQTRLIAFHPGTTDTPLSKPFQGRVPAHKLFTPNFVAARMSTLMDAAVNGPQIQFLDWDGLPIPW